MLPSGAAPPGQRESDAKSDAKSDASLLSSQPLLTTPFVFFLDTPGLPVEWNVQGAAGVTPVSAQGPTALPLPDRHAEVS